VQATNLTGKVELFCRLFQNSSEEITEEIMGTSDFKMCCNDCTNEHNINMLTSMSIYNAHYCTVPLKHSTDVDNEIIITKNATNDETYEDETAFSA